MSETLNWYNKISHLYQLSNDFPYKDVRTEAINRLNLNPGDKVLDLFCGTGVNFPHICDKLGNCGEVLGVDGSNAMLNRAKQTISGMRSKNLTMELLKLNFLNNNELFELNKAIRNRAFNKYLFTLGLTCIESWRYFFKIIYDSAPNNSYFVVMDVYSKKRGFGANIIDTLGSGNCSLPVWEELEKLGTEFEKQKFKPFYFLDVSVVVSSGIKP